MSSDVTSQSATALLRRMEELAARAGDDDAEPIGPVLTAALSGLRAELGGLRSELGSLRAELGVVRSGVEGSTGRMTAALASARGELSDVGRAHEALVDRVHTLAEQVDTMLAAVPELRSAVETLSDRTSGEVDGSLRRLHTDVTGTVETAAEDLRRTLSSGLTQAAAGTRAAEVAWTETRSALEERLATVEDTLDALAERLEALGRDTAAAAGDRLDRVDEQLAALQRSVQAEVELAAAERDRMRSAEADAADSFETWGETVRTALSDLGEAVSGGLTRLAATLDEAVRGSSAEDRVHLRERLSDLADIVDRAFGDLEEQVGALRAATDSGSTGVQSAVAGLQEHVEQRIETMRVTLADGLAGAGDQVLDRLGSTIAELAETNAAGADQTQAELSLLRADLADALEDVRGRISTTVEEARDAIGAALDDQREEFDELSRQLRTDVLDRVETSSAEVRTGLDELRAPVASAAGSAEVAAQRSAALQETVSALSAELTALGEEVASLRGDWTPHAEGVIAAAREAGEAAVAEFRDQTDAAVTAAQQVGESAVAGFRQELAGVVDAARQAAEAAVAEFRDEASALLTEVRSALRRTSGTVDEAVGLLHGGTERLTGSSQLLLAYLAARDRLLEQQRDGYLRDILEQFAADLPGKDRRVIAGRVGEALERRRDTRDADRWRRSQAGQPALQIPEPPAQLQALAEDPEPTPRAQRRALAKAAEPAEPVSTEALAAAEALAATAVPSSSTAAPATGSAAAVLAELAAADGGGADPAAESATSAAPVVAAPEAAVPLVAAPVDVTPTATTEVSPGTPAEPPQAEAARRGLFRRRGTAAAAAGEGVPGAEAPPAELFAVTATPEPAQNDDGPAQLAAAPADTPAGAAARKAPATRTTGSRTPAKQTTAKQAPARKAPAKRAPAKRAPAKKATAKQATARKVPAKKAPAKSAPAKSAAASTGTAKQAPAKRSATAAKRPAAAPPPAKRSTGRSATSSTTAGAARTRTPAKRAATPVPAGQTTVMEATPSSSRGAGDSS